jgi:hypothetical protein
MVLIGLLGLCVGALLAQHFRVRILVPATIVAVVGLAIAEIASRQNFVQGLLAGGTAACTMQVGYLLGLFVKPRQRPVGGSDRSTQQ